MSSLPPSTDRDALTEQMLEHFEQLEVQFSRVREGLTHSHRLATLGTIASIVAHEFNNILTPMVSYAQMALATPDDHALMQKAVEKALLGAERAASISSSLLGFARERDEEQAASVRETIDEAIACLAREPRKDGIDLRIDVPDVQVAMPPLQLQQVFLNLILNAKKAMRRKGGRLCIEGRLDGQHLCVDVMDTGPGIPPQVMNSLFDPFVTHQIGEDDGPGQRKGTGLGLCICRDLLQSVGGNIEAESTPGEGATFRLHIPIADTLAQHEAA